MLSGRRALAVWIGGLVLLAVAIAGAWVLLALTARYPASTVLDRTVPPDLQWIVAERCTEEAGTDLIVTMFSADPDELRLARREGDELSHLDPESPETRTAADCLRRYDLVDARDASALDETPRDWAVARDWAYRYTWPCLLAHALEVDPPQPADFRVDYRMGYAPMWGAYSRARDLDIDALLEIRATCPPVPPHLRGGAIGW